MATSSISRHEGVTTLDLLKCVAALLMLTDHVGLYLYEDDWLRVAGRPVAVIFGFLIGYSASTRVPPSWIGLGLGLSLLDLSLNPQDTPHTLDILISLALTRILIPFFDGLHKAHPLLLVPLVGAVALMTEPINAFLEYGAEVPIVAILGVAVRLDSGRPAETTARHATALAALIAIGLTTLHHFEFKGPHAIACIGLLAVTMIALGNFTRISFAVPAPCAPLMRWIGRNTLMIYAVHLAILLVTASALAPDTASDADNEN